jgi:hypothetical protein
MLTENDIEKEKRAERRMRYSFNAEQIDTVKRHQWDMTHYALLIFAGIVGITTLIIDKKLFCTKYYILIGIGLMILDTYILAFIIYMLWIYQHNLMSNRHTTIELETTFETRYEIRKNAPIPINYFSYWFQGGILFSFKLSIILGWGFSMLYVFRKLIN